MAVTFMVVALYLAPAEYRVYGNYPTHKACQAKRQALNLEVQPDATLCVQVTQQAYENYLKGIKHNEQLTSKRLHSNGDGQRPNDL